MHCPSWALMFYIFFFYVATIQRVDLPSLYHYYEHYSLSIFKSCSLFFPPKPVFFYHQTKNQEFSMSRTYTYTTYQGTLKYIYTYPSHQGGASKTYSCVWRITKTLFKGEVVGRAMFLQWNCFIF